MADSVYTFSPTAGSNTALDGIAYDNNQLTHGNIDNLFRATHAVLAQLVDDLGAVNTVGGTGDAVTVTLASGITAYATGQLFRFIAGAANTGAATMNVNSIGAKAIRKISGGADVALAAGDIAAGQTYTVIYRSSANSSAGAWVLLDTEAVLLNGAQTVAGVKTFSSNPVLSGGGISFPATQVASADANTLDDYEEGTWTPVLNFGGATTGITYTIQQGSYTKIGRFVFFMLAITLSSKGSATGSATITGLPFTPVATFQGSVTGNYQTMNSATALVGLVSAASTTITLHVPAATGLGGCADTNFNNTSVLNLSGAYHTS